MRQPVVYLGTSGFADPTWRGSVYPERLPRPQWLIHYEQQLQFNALEINYTYYRMPSHATIGGLVRKTTPDFRFTIKAHRSLTHDILDGDRIVDSPPAFAEFREGMRPLAESGRLGGVLAQFPMAFDNRPACRDYLRATIDRLGDLGLIVEFRHRSWLTEETVALLRERRAGWCAVDEPALARLMPWAGEVTSDVAYARFHGRNAARWFGASVAERYDYLYADAELRELLGRVDELGRRAKALYVFFNNCHAGAAAKNAARLRELLAERGLMPPPSRTSLF